jgi:hypothetical protein
MQIIRTSKILSQQLQTMQRRSLERSGRIDLLSESSGS